MSELTRPVPSTCSICGGAADRRDQHPELWLFMTCTRCGVYRISLRDAAEMRLRNEQYRARLTRQIHEANDRGYVYLVGSSPVPDAWGLLPKPPLLER